jgi:hypothetical protein
VDEDRRRSVTVWCAGEPMDEANGSIGVVPRSHERVDFMRAVNNRYYEVHAEVAAAIAERPVLTLAAGEAVIFDNRLVHFSPPNPSAAPRLAWRRTWPPAGEPVFHYWFDDEGNAHRLEVEPEFWLSYNIGTDPRDASGWVQDVVVPEGRFA